MHQWALVFLAMCAICCARVIEKRSLFMLSDNVPTVSLAMMVDKPSVSIFKAPRNTNAQEGQSITLECETSLGQPAPVITWLKDGTPVPSIPEANEIETTLNAGLKIVGKSSTKSRLVLPCLTLQSAGTYTCLATNGVTAVMKNATVTVTERAEDTEPPTCTTRDSAAVDSAPVITMWTADRIEREGASIQLFCRAEGHPRPKVQWFKMSGTSTEYHLIDPSASESFKYLPNGDLLIVSAGVKTPGVGHTLKCVASNNLGQDEVTSFVMITPVRGDLLLQ